MIVVAFIPKTRSTLLMGILKSLGCNVIGDEAHKYETNAVSHGVNTAGFGDFDAVKVAVMPGLHQSLLNPGDKVILCARHPHDVEDSQNRNKVWIGFDKKFNYARFLDNFEELTDLPGVSRLIIDTDDLMSNPRKTIRDIVEFVGKGFENIDAALGVIVPEKTTVHSQRIHDHAADKLASIKSRGARWR